MPHMDILTVVLSGMVIVVLGWAMYLMLSLRRLRRAERGVQADPVPAWKPMPKPKCYIRTFVYQDSHQEVRHSRCQHIPVSTMTDAWGQSLHPESLLLRVAEKVHYL